VDTSYQKSDRAKVITQASITRLIGSGLIGSGLVGIGLIAVGLMAALTGCSGDSKPQEVTAASSGFKPADEKSPPAKSTADTPPSNTAPSNTAAASSNKAPAPPSLPTTPPLPTFDPTQIDPTLAAKSYMKLEMTSSQDPKELVRFLGSVDRSLQEMQKDATSGVINDDVILDRGMAVSRIKLTASERLEKVASTPEEKSKALIGKLEALGQMAQFKDVPSSDELRIVAKQLASSEDPKVALQAQRMQLMSAVVDMKNQSATPESVVELAAGLLEKMGAPDMSIFTSVFQATQALDAVAGQGEGESNTSAEQACNQLVDLLEAKFRDVNNPQIGMAAWRLKMQRLPDFESYLQVLDTRMAMSADPAQVGVAAKQLMEKVPSPWTAIALTQIATQFEYMGNTTLAKELYDIAATQLETTKTEELKQQIQESISGFKAKSESIGKPLALDSLVDTDGKPLDPARYEGKVVLVDFWATWCGPCIAEIPNIRKVYDSKHAEGFEVIAVNLDDQRSDLDTFLTQQEMPWSVYVSAVPGKAGMETPLARSLMINAIPFTMLIGRDGKVAEIHVRGAALQTKVEQLLNTTPKSE
jgi:thiol-disulfide isomerase/thioredoxin